MRKKKIESEKPGRIRRREREDRFERPTAPADDVPDGIEEGERAAVEAPVDHLTPRAPCPPIAGGHRVEVPEQHDPRIAGSVQAPDQAVPVLRQGDRLDGEPGALQHGAEHLTANHDPVLANPDSLSFKGAMPLGISEPVAVRDFGPRKVEYYARLEHWSSFGKAIGLCYFGPAPRSFIPIDEVVSAVNAATG